MDVKIISKQEERQIFDEERMSGREYITYDRREECDGLLYDIFRDTRNGDKFAVRSIRSVHMGFNSNEPGTVDALIATVEREGAASASWGVTGRTLHSMLARQLEDLLPQYVFVIGYNYECLVFKDEHTKEVLRGEDR